MRLRHHKAYLAIAVLLIGVFAQLALQVAIAQPQFIARLTATRDGQPILVNGNPTPVGTTITPGSIIETGADQSATINLDNGILEVGQDTVLALGLEEGRVKVTLRRGCAALRTKRGTEGEIATDEATIAKSDRERDDRIVVCFIDGKVTQGPAADALFSGVPAAADVERLGAAAWWAIGAGIVSAIVIPIVAFRGFNPSPS